MPVPSALRFELRESLVATVPPEARGLRRDDVGLVVANGDGVAHARFRDVTDWLERDDLLVVNTSPTMPAAIDGSFRGQPVAVHLSTLEDAGTWIVEMRHTDRSGPVLDGTPGESVHLRSGALVLLEPADLRHDGVRLWRTEVSVAGGVRRHLRRHGRPIRYSYVASPWPLSMYQTVFADQSHWPGSAEMPSAGRPFSRELVERLGAAGVRIAPLGLHTGVSSQEAWETPLTERFSVPSQTARLVNETRGSGHRVIAVGTTVTRALETVGNDEGEVVAGNGWTDLVLGPDRPAHVVDGIITGWHPPEASHLALLEAVAGESLVSAAYAAALDVGYLWHEFGDSCLLLPERG